ncbi:MAG: molybdopterin molybdotransferase MoeA, partial [Pseudonocardiaceae bacterium]
MLVHDHSERIAEQADAHTPDRTLTWDEARAAAHRAGPVLSPEPVGLAQTLGRVLAEPLHALVAAPPVDCSAMDGYAVCGPSPWSVVAQVRAGDGVPEPLRPGTACEVATGAPLPPWTGGVLPYEQAWRAGELVSGWVDPGRHVRWAGEECAAGDEVLPAGVALGPAALGLAATLGHDELPVRRAPRVDALVTGNELLEVGIPAPGQVRDAIGPMLPGLVSWAGGSFGGAVRLVDSAAQLIGALRGAEAEIVLVSGSSS